MVAAIRASTVASMSGVGGGAMVAVGEASCVAEIPAATVAPTSGSGVGVAVGKAADTAAWMVAPRSGVSVGVAAGTTVGAGDVQPRAKRSSKVQTERLRAFMSRPFATPCQRRAGNQPVISHRWRSGLL